MQIEGKPLIAKPIDDPHECLVNTLATCLIREPSFYQSAEQRVSKLVLCCDNVAKKDPEFIFQLAYYARTELNLRSSTNFLLAYAATKMPQCHKFLTKYMPHCINLPTDLLEVVEIAQALSSNTTTKLKINATLKKLCGSIFSKFSDYQLGKYCSENARKRELTKKKNKEKEPLKKKKRAMSGSGSGSEDMEISPQEEGHAKIADKNRNKVAMKKLIRTCHICEPKYEVMCILGKRYPTKEKFETMCPGKKFDEKKVGKRMRIPIPITWETELSAKGNKPEVWTELIQSKKLPYMAMLRNIRNLLVTGVPEAIHNQVCERIQDYNQVINSKLFPFRFFSAYEAIKIDLNELKERKLNPAKAIEEAKHPQRQAMMRGRVMRGRGMRGRQMVQRTERPRKVIIPNELPSAQIIENYHKALDNAVKIATAHNIKPIRGNTVVFSDTSGSMSTPVSGAGKVSASARSCMDIGILMSLMLKYACEKCDFFIFSSPGANGSCYMPITEFNKEDLLANIELIETKGQQLGGGTDFPFEFWLDAINTKKQIDLFVIFSDMMISEGHNDIGGSGNMTVTSIIREYREKVNPKMIYVAVDLRGYSLKVPVAEDEKTDLNILICGYSDTILRFISERQVSQVEYIKKLASKIA